MSLYSQIKDECTWLKSSDNHTNNARVAAKVCHESTKMVKSAKIKKNHFKSAWSFSFTHKIILNVNERRKGKKRKMISEIFAQFSIYIIAKCTMAFNRVTFFPVSLKANLWAFFLFVFLCTMLNADARLILNSLWCLISHSKEFYMMWLQTTKKVLLLQSWRRKKNQRN